MSRDFSSTIHSGTENFKNSRPRKLVKSNKSISENGKYPKTYCVKLIHFISRVGIDFFRFSGPLCNKVDTVIQRRQKNS